MRRLLVLAALVVAARPCGAQPIDEPVPRLVADVHGSWGGIASSPGWVPDVPSNTPIPNRGFGASIGAHAYPLRLGLVTFGIGASVIAAKGTGDPASVTSTSSSRASATPLPVVTTRMISVVPQISINFGHRYGWSHLSAGYGPTRIDSTASAAGTLPASRAPNLWNPAINFGGGARWFMKRHLAASFDVRFVKLSSRAPTLTAAFAKRSQLVNLLVGISVQ